jgi:hypothetical protein
MPRRGKIIPFPGAGRPAGGRERPAQPPRETPEERSLVELRRCRDEAEALVVKSLLESEGIPCALRSRFVRSLHPFTVGDQGEVAVLVPGGLVERARLLLARGEPGPSFP